MKPPDNRVLAPLFLLLAGMMIYRIYNSFKTGKAPLTLEVWWKHTAERRKEPLKFWIFSALNLLITAIFVFIVAMLVLGKK